MNIGKLAVSTISCAHHKNACLIPKLQGYNTIIIMDKSKSKWWPLSSSYLKDANGFIIENKQQFQKVYPSIPEMRYYKHNKLVWNHPDEIHLDENNKLTSEYFNWRVKGLTSKYAIKNPVNPILKHTCVFSLNLKHKKTDHITSRKEIVTDYITSVRRCDLFGELHEMLMHGENILLCEHNNTDSDNDYTIMYNNTNGNNSLCYNIDRNILETLLNDKHQKFNHVYSLAWALIDETTK